MLTMISILEMLSTQWRTSLTPEVMRWKRWWKPSRSKWETWMTRLSLLKNKWRKASRPQLNAWEEYQTWRVMGGGRIYGGKDFMMCQKVKRKTCMWRWLKYVKKYSHVKERRILMPLMSLIGWGNTDTAIRGLLLGFISRRHREAIWKAAKKWVFLQSNGPRFAEDLTKQDRKKPTEAVAPR